MEKLLGFRNLQEKLERGVACFLHEDYKKDEWMKVGLDKRYLRFYLINEGTCQASARIFF